MVLDNRYDSDIKELLKKLLMVRKIYADAYKNVDDVALSHLLQKYAHRRRIQAFELSRAFDIEQMHEELKFQINYSTAVQAQLRSYEEMGSDQELILYLINFEKEIASAYQQAIRTCEGEVKRFILDDHRKNTHRQLTRLKIISKEVG